MCNSNILYGSCDQQETFVWVHIKNGFLKRCLVLKTLGVSSNPKALAPNPIHFMVGLMGTSFSWERENMFPLHDKQVWHFVKKKSSFEATIVII